jgi:hypothetical protein
VIGLLLWLILRPLLEPLARLLASLVAGAALVVVVELLLGRFLDPELPRSWTALLMAGLAAAALFLRGSWRRSAMRRARRP